MVLPSPSPPPQEFGIPRAPFPQGAGHGQAQPVVHGAVPVTGEQPVSRAQVGIALGDSGTTGHTGNGDTGTPGVGTPGGSHRERTRGGDTQSHRG